jgi:hypothetical protein
LAEPGASAQTKGRQRAAPFAVVKGEQAFVFERQGLQAGGEPLAPGKGVLGDVTKPGAGSGGKDLVGNVNEALAVVVKHHQQQRITDAGAAAHELGGLAGLVGIGAGHDDDGTCLRPFGGQWLSQLRSRQEVPFHAEAPSVVRG